MKTSEDLRDLLFRINREKVIPPIKTPGALTVFRDIFYLLTMCREILLLPLPKSV